MKRSFIKVIDSFISHFFFNIKRPCYKELKELCLLSLYKRGLERQQIKEVIENNFDRTIPKEDLKITLKILESNRMIQSYNLTKGKRLYVIEEGGKKLIEDVQTKRRILLGKNDRVVSR